MKKLLAMLLAALMVFSMVGCNSEKETEALFKMPNFEEKPVAEGDSAIITLQEMVKNANSVPIFNFSLSHQLDNSSQTIYTKEDMSDGKVLEKKVSPLGILKTHLESVAIDKMLPVTVDHFKVTEDGKMAHMTNVALTVEFQGGVLTDFSFDLTTATLIVRAVATQNDSTGNTTYFMTSKIAFIGENQFKTAFIYEEYGDSTAAEYVMKSVEEMTFTIDDKGEVIEGSFKCTQDTSVMSNVVGENDKGMYVKTEESAERILIDMNVKMVDGKYEVTRNLTMNQSEGTLNPAEAKQLYTASQILKVVDGKYRLTETARGTDSSGKEVENVQFVVFTPVSDLDKNESETPKE